jgi:sodium/proline symporter
MVTAVSFVVFLLAFVGVGVYSATRRRQTADDYLVASRSIHPWLTALSAVASNNSGFMFMGLIGATYVSGIRAMWLMVGWILGDWIAWLFVHERLRKQSGSVNTIPSFLGRGLPGGAQVAGLAGLITLLFLSVYAAAQLQASGKALHHVTGWNVDLGVIIGAVIVVAYCFAGGIRASIWTDAAQSVVMIVSMAILCAVAVTGIGGFGALWESLAAIDPELTVLFPDYRFGFVGFLLGWIGAGLGVVGQPHIMIRAMAIDHADNMARARRIYVTWYLAFAAACIVAGLAARVILSVPPEDPELALLILGDDLFGGALAILVGLLLAGVFAATISTADSQILSCSAAITQDLAPGAGASYRAVKLATIGVAALALAFAVFGSDSVFVLVTFAWSTLASGLGPLLIVRVMKWPITRRAALATMAGGIAGSFAWFFAGLDGDMYQVLPGMVSGFAVYLLLTHTSLRHPEDE